jgi:hypothetical protein
VQTTEESGFGGYKEVQRQLGLGGFEERKQSIPEIRINMAEVYPGE